MHETKGQQIGNAPSLHLFHTTSQTASLRAESAPIHAVVNAVHKYYTLLITMTSLQFTQVQVIPGMYVQTRVPLSIQTYDSSTCTWHGFSVKKMQGWGFANTLTFAFMHHPYLVYILFGMPSLHLFTFLMFLFSCYMYHGVFLLSMYTYSYRLFSLGVLHAKLGFAWLYSYLSLERTEHIFRS